MLTITILGRIHPSLNSWPQWHWAKRNKEKKSWETEIGWLVKSAGWKGEPLKQSTVVIDYYCRNKRRHDHDNLSPKFIMDGLVKAGVLHDDSVNDTFLKWRIHCEGPRRTVITVAETKGADAA